MDIQFIQFYIKKMHSQNLEEYFNITSAVASHYRRKSIPESRINEFIIREKSFDIHELFERIYPKK